MRRRPVVAGGGGPELWWWPGRITGRHHGRETRPTGRGRL